MNNGRLGIHGWILPGSIMKIPIPKDETFEPQPTNASEEWIKWYLDVPNWRCPTCKSVVFGRCLFCAYCKFKLRVHTPRPEA